MLDAKEISKDFPALKSSDGKNRIVYFDNAAMMQMPQTVIDALTNQATCCHANVHRGIHLLSEKATLKLEEARSVVRRFIGAESDTEIVFTSGTTQGINLVADSLAATGIINRGDLVVTTVLEHHSNLLPWLNLGRKCRAQVEIVPIDQNGDIDIEILEKCFEKKPKIVAVTAVSNVLGTVNDVEDIVRKAHDAGAFVLVDAAQALRSGEVNVAKWGCDFLAFSGHKIGSPSGIGALYIKASVAEKLQPPIFGGGMVDTIFSDGVFSVEAMPYRWEAGTPNVDGAIAMGVALDYLFAIGLNEIAQYEKYLLYEVESMLRDCGSYQILGAPIQREGSISFISDDLSPFDIATLLDSLDIAVRSGAHCAQLVHRAFGVDGSVRISPAFYNTEEDIAALSKALIRVDRLRK